MKIINGIGIRIPETGRLIGVIVYDDKHAAITDALGTLMLAEAGKMFKTPASFQVPVKVIVDDRYLEPSVLAAKKDEIISELQKEIDRLRAEKEVFHAVRRIESYLAE